MPSFMYLQDSRINMNKTNDLDCMYTARWMTRVRAREDNSARDMTNAFVRDLTPTTVLDVGAGPCCHANWLAQRGCRVVAVNGASHARQFSADDVEFIQLDFRSAWSLNRTFDLVLCLEVLEHLGEDVEPLLCDGLVRHARRWLVVTAAAPGQRGRHHVNLKPREYWIRKMRDYGMTYDAKRVARWQDEWRRLKVVKYFINNLMVFERPEPLTE